MRRLLTRSVIVLAAALALMQFVRPVKRNPAVDPARTLQAAVSASHPAMPVVTRACANCHSNQTEWPWYSHVAPVSWLVVHDVNEARTAVNFSDWAAYAPERQRKLLRESCEEVKEGEMPLSMYALVHPEAKLAPADVRAICDLASMN